MNTTLDRNKPRRVGDTGGESDDPSTVAAAFQQATSRQGDAAAAAASAIIITRKRSGDSSSDNGEREEDGDKGNGNDGDALLMRLLPSSCRQGVLCRVARPGGRESKGDMVVLLGSTLAGSGVFSGMDGAWFERVCACLALGAAGAAAATPAAADAGGR